MADIQVNAEQCFPGGVRDTVSLIMLLCGKVMHRHNRRHQFLYGDNHGYVFFGQRQ